MWKRWSETLMGGLLFEILRSTSQAVIVKNAELDETKSKF
jgi:hypothetical protein